MRTTLAIAAIATAMALSPAIAHAATECQGGVAAGGGSSPASAWQEWQDNVAASYGSAWANVDLAQNKNVATITIPALLGGNVTTYTAFAVPCRIVRATAGLTGAFGNFEVMPGDASMPKPLGAFQKAKLAASFQ